MDPFAASKIIALEAQRAAIVAQTAYQLAVIDDQLARLKSTLPK